MNAPRESWLSRLLGAGRAALSKVQPTTPPATTQEPEMWLSPHFSLSELTVTSQPLPNEPGPAEIENLKRLCLNVLEPWRTEVGPLRISSGFRSQAINAAVGGSRTSEHLRGLAADVVPMRTPLPLAWLELVGLVKEGLPVGQAIAYQRPHGAGWIHCSVDLTAPYRAELLVQDEAGRYHAWSSWGSRALVLVLPSG